MSTPGDPIDVNAFDPGAMPKTGLARDWGPLGRSVWNGPLPPLVPLLRRSGIPFSTAEVSGRAVARLATERSLEGVSGRYFEIGEETRSPEESCGREKAAELWETIATLVGLRPEETPLRGASTVSGA